MNPAAPNLPPLPIDDPHARIANHEDLLPKDMPEIEKRMLTDADDFAAWEAEVRTIDADPAPTPEDARNKEKLASLFDREPYTATVEAAKDVPPKEKRERSPETGEILKALGELADTKPQDTDEINEKERSYRMIESALANMGIVDKDATELTYRDAFGATGHSMTQWQARKDAVIAEAIQLLQEHPDQSHFFIMQGRHYEGNTDAYHAVPKGETTTPWDKATQDVDSHRIHHDRIANHRYIANADLEAAAVRVNLRDAKTKYAGMRGRHEDSRILHETFQELLKELPLDTDDGAAQLNKFVEKFKIEEGRDMDDAVKALHEGTTFREFLEAGEDPIERAKAEQPLWQDIEYTRRAAAKLHSVLINLESQGRSKAHSHYREAYAKYMEVKRAHVAAWQRWQSVRQERAAALNPLDKPDFQGRRPVYVAGDQQKGLYVDTGRGNPINIVYPDASTRRVAFDPATGAAKPENRVNLDGTDWKAPEPLTLTYEEAAPEENTAGVMGHVMLLSAGVARAAHVDRRRVDHRDLNALQSSAHAAEYHVRMDPTDRAALQSLYDTTRLTEQRLNEQIAVIESVDPAARTAEQNNSLPVLRQVRGGIQARIKYLEHGTEGNASTMGSDASVSFRGTMYGEQRPRNWRVAVTGHAEKTYKKGVTQRYNPDGSRI